MKTNASAGFSVKMTLVLSALIIFQQTVFAQRKLRDYFITGSSVLVSGMLDGTIESISYHYENGFKPRFRNANDRFWDPSQSWKNKYKNGDCSQGPRFTGSTNVFAFTTDAYHLLRTAKRAAGTFTLAYYLNQNYRAEKSKPHNWKNVACDFLVLTAIRCIGFNITYNLMFNPRKNYLQN